jgi:putative Holliday junction resolvase
MRYFDSAKDFTSVRLGEDCRALQGCQGKRGGRYTFRSLRLLALDVGDARIGVALSDETETLASGLVTLRSQGPRKDARQVAALVREHAVGELVVGLPLRLDGSRGPQAEKVTALVERLRRVLRIPVGMRDERLTSVEAGERLAEAGVRGRARKARLDQAAACLVLQELLDERKAVAAGGRA